MMSDSGKATSGNKTSQWDRGGGMEAWGTGGLQTRFYISWQMSLMIMLCLTSRTRMGRWGFTVDL